MAATSYTFSEGAIKLRYREPYLSEALNTKYQTIVPVGIYDGFEPVASGTALNLNLVGSTNGSVAVATSSLDSTTQVSLHIPSGTLELNLTAFTNTTVVVGIEASYQRPSVTSAIIKTYNLTAGDIVPSYAVVICRVVVPASGMIPTANITLTGRSLPWQARGRDALPLIDIVKNGDFHFFSPLQTTDLPAMYWNLASGAGSFAVVNTVGPSSSNDNVLVATSAAASSANTTKVVQYACIPVTPDPMRVRIKAQYQQVQTLSSGNAVVSVLFRSVNTNAITETLALPLTMPTGGLLGTWYPLEFFAYIEATTVSYEKFLSAVQIDLNSAVFPAASVAFRVTDVSVQVEQASKPTDLLLENTGDTRHTSLRVYDPSDITPSAQHTKIRYIASTNTYYIFNPLNSPNSNVTLSVGLLSSSYLDTVGTLFLGTVATTTGVTISKTGATTTISGNAVVVGSLTAPTIIAPNINAAASGAASLYIGTTAGTGQVLIGRSGQSLYINSHTTIAGSATIVGSGSSSPALIVSGGISSSGSTIVAQAGASQTGALFTWQTSGGTLLGQITTAGALSTPSLYVGTVLLANKIVPPAYAFASASAGSVALTTSFVNVPIATSEFARTLVVDTTADKINNIEAGIYSVEYTYTGRVASPTGGANFIYFSLSTTTGGNVILPTNTATAVRNPDGFSPLVANSYFSVSYQGIVSVRTTSVSNDLSVQAATNIGTAGISVDIFTFTMIRIAPYS